MQDIVFYATANETLGAVRDYANVRNLSAPVLTLGVSVCLRMRLFSAMDSTTPYPIASLNGIEDWKWSMDGDFDRATTCKLVADTNGITVHTVTDTVNGETMNFTEFVIPISNMNTEELTAWLGSEKTRSGLTGELVGYDSNANAAFVLQIEDFTVRNRVAGLGDPTALDQEYVTHGQAEQLIQTAVASSANTKQDKLTSANAGTGINISSSGTISVENIPQSAVSGLATALSEKQNALTAGYRMAIVSGSTVDQSRYYAIEPAITAPANQTTTVTLSAGKAFEIHAVGNNAKVLLNREDPPFARSFGLEGHAEIFVANTGYIQTGANVVLSQPFEPDAVNNCTIRFHDGKCIISVEDHIAGHVVTVSSGSTIGSLPYALHDVSDEYIAFDATLNGLTIDLSGATTYAREKHVVGNGYAETVISGGITCTSKTTFSNLSMLDVAINGGTMTLGDAFIPSGSTVSCAGGGLVIEKVCGNSGTIELCGRKLTVSGTTANASGCTFANGGSNTTNGGTFFITNSGVVNLSGCIMSGASTNYGGGLYLLSGGMATLTKCVVTNNFANAGQGAYVLEGTLNLVSCVFSKGQLFGAQNITLGKTTAKVNIYGSCHFDGLINKTASTSGGTVSLASGAVLDLAGNTNATPIIPGGGIIIPAGAIVRIIGNNGPTGSCGYFSDLAVTGTTISNLGRIYGATVTVPPLEDGGDRGPWELQTTEGTTTVSAISGQSQQIVVTGGLYGIIGQ